MYALWLSLKQYLSKINKSKINKNKYNLKKEINVYKLNKKELECRNRDLRIQVSVLRFKLAKLQGTSFNDTYDLDLDMYAEYMFTHGNKALQFELSKPTDDLPDKRKLTSIPKVK